MSLHDVHAAIDTGRAHALRDRRMPPDPGGRPKLRTIAIVAALAAALLVGAVSAVRPLPIAGLATLGNEFETVPGPYNPNQPDGRFARTG